MRRVSADSAELTDEYGIQVGRWSQYAGSDGLPFDAMWCVVPPGSRTEPDCHPEVELAVVVDGAAAFESGDTTVEAPQGAAVLLASNERHVVHNQSDAEPLVMLSIYWLPTDLGDSGDGP